MRREYVGPWAARRDLIYVLTFAGAAGLLTSVVLLQFGVRWMWVRYPVAVAVGYGVFVGMLRYWLWRRARSFARHRARRDSSGLDIIDLPSGGGGGSDVVGPPVHFGGGSGGGGGAGGSWGSGTRASLTPPRARGGGGIDFGLDDAVVILLPLVLTAGVLIYTVVVAPALLAEVLLDGALVAGMYGRFRHLPRRHWLRAALRRTWLPALLTAFFLFLAGLAMHHYVPWAVSMGGVWDAFIR